MKQLNISVYLSLTLMYLTGCSSLGPVYYADSGDNRCINKYLMIYNQCRSTDWLETRHCYQGIQRRCVIEDDYVKNQRPNVWTRVP